MAEFRRASRERINVFRVDDDYLFKHYVDEAVFAEIERYYDEYEYRFEVPADRFAFVRKLLEDNDYQPVVVEDPEPFTVLKRKYTDHPDALFRDAVFHLSRDNFNCFVMKTREAAERAVDRGAVPLAERNVEL